jgi:hypothetical protein
VVIGPRDVEAPRSSNDLSIGHVFAFPNTEEAALSLVSKYLDPVVAVRVPTHAYLFKAISEVYCGEGVVFESAN